MKLVINGSSINVERADDHAARQLGLMYRNFLPTDSGMLFSFPNSEERSFWMKNTYIPLSIAYLDSEGTILNIEDMEPHNMLGIPSAGPAMFALEANKGWFTDKGITVGDIVQGLLASSTSLFEAAAFSLSDPNFHYSDVAVPIIEEIMEVFTAGLEEQRLLNTYTWDYPIAPDTWAENWEDEGGAFFDVDVDISFADFSADHPGWNIDADAGYGESAEALITVRAEFSPALEMTPDLLKKLRQELSNVIPHEIHHLTQRGKPFERPNCPVPPPTEGDSYFYYFTQACEVPAFLIGFRGEAADSGLAIEQLVDSYLNNYVDVGKINQQEHSEIKDIWLGHEKWDEEEMNEALLREYVRGILLEVTTLPEAYFKKIDAAILASRFWDEPNSQEDIDLISTRAGSVNATPAMEALTIALQDIFDELELVFDVVINSHDTTDIDGMTLHPDHPAYPNRWLTDARWYVSKQNPGRNTIDMESMTAEVDLPALDPNALTRHIAQTVRHELVHYKQMKKQGEKKGLDDAEAFEEMIQDPSQVPDDNDPKYWEVYEPTGEFDEEGNEKIRKEGRKKLYIQDYLRSHIEIDAHAHDGAEDLLAVYGKEDAMDMLRHGFDLDDPQLPNAIRHYWEQLPEDDPTLDKLRSKLYTQMEQMAP
jgi:uncharacterized membrane protein (UPF0127 family)